MFFVANKNLIPVVFLLLAVPMLGGAEPKPVCDAPTYQFGRVNQSAVITNVFLIRNDGDTTFVAGMPRTTCSCTKARLSQRMIGPGETAELTAVFTAARRGGPQQKVIYLPSANSEEPVIKFYMEGFVEGGGQSD